MFRLRGNIQSQSIFRPDNAVGIARRHTVRSLTGAPILRIIHRQPMGSPFQTHPFTTTPGKLGVILPGEFSFFANGYTKLSDTYLPTAENLAPTHSWMTALAPREENDWHGLYKLALLPLLSPKTSKGTGSGS